MNKAAPPSVKELKQAGIRMTRAAAITLLLEFAFILAWSSGCGGARLAAEHAPTFLVLFWRFALAALLLAPLAVRAGLFAWGHRTLS